VCGPAVAFGPEVQSAKSQLAPQRLDAPPPQFDVEKDARAAGGEGGTVIPGRGALLVILVPTAAEAWMGTCDCDDVLYPPAQFLRFLL
jgi:hypothetical protein